MWSPQILDETLFTCVHISLYIHTQIYICMYINVETGFRVIPFILSSYYTIHIFFFTTNDPSYIYKR